MLDGFCAALPCRAADDGGNRKGLAVGILWLLLVALVVFWLIGFIADIAGGLIHILLVVALVVLIYNLVTGRRST